MVLKNEENQLIVKQKNLKTMIFGVMCLIYDLFEASSFTLSSVNVRKNCRLCLSDSQTTKYCLTKNY